MKHSRIDYKNDIKVLGRVVSIATDNKVAEAEQIFDTTFKYKNYPEGMDQYEINRLLRDAIINVEGDVTNLKEIQQQVAKIPTLESDMNNLKSRVSTLEGKVATLEACCAEVRATLQNLPTGAGDASFTVSPKLVELTVGETAQLSVEKGADLTGTVRYSSNNTNVATVSASGKITAVGAGETIVTVSVDGFRPTEDVIVKVTAPTPTYRITFNPNNGNPNFHQDVLEGNKLVTVTDPTKEGYTFNGWHVNSDTGTVWNFNDPVTSTMMLIAGYTQNDASKYTLTYKDGDVTLSTQQYEAGQAITPIADPTKSGYTFNGWSPSVPATMPANDLTVTAQWTEVIVPETHVYTLEVDPISTTITAGNTTTLTATPKDNGTAMSGQTITWSSSNTSAATVSNGVVTAITEGTATTITATWTSPDGNKTATCAVTVTAEPTYTLTFDTAGGSPIAARTYKAGATIEAVTPPTKEGYNFTGWTPAIPATMPAENLTVVAQWTEVSHEYDLTISPESMSLTVGQTTGNVITATCTDNGTAVNNPPITWTSSNTSIATISGGTVNPIAAGTTVITATWNGKQKTCSVTVSEPQQDEPFTGGIGRLNFTGHNYKIKAHNETGTTGEWYHVDNKDNMNPSTDDQGQGVYYIPSFPQFGDINEGVVYTTEMIARDFDIVPDEGYRIAGFTSEFYDDNGGTDHMPTNVGFNSDKTIFGVYAIQDPHLAYGVITIITVPEDQEPKAPTSISVADITSRTPIYEMPKITVQPYDAEYTLNVRSNNADIWGTDNIAPVGGESLTPFNTQITTTSGYRGTAQITVTATSLDGNTSVSGTATVTAN